MRLRPNYLLSVFRCFNSRTHAGCDSFKRRVDTFLGKFQFTHPRGVRLRQPYFKQGDYNCFNSRTHAGCDIYCNNIPYIYSQVSIHAPTRGATDVRSISLQGGIYRFNSRTHAGCDSLQMTNVSMLCSFNSRTHAGCDLFATNKLV